jgi:hypothetical protein
LTGNLELNDTIPERNNRSVNPTARHHAVTGLEIGEHILNLAPLLLLRPDDQEIPNREQGRKKEKELA